MRVLVYDLIKNDIELCSDLAKELAITKGIVMKYATDVSQNGLGKMLKRLRARIA
jgi:hypothetical protein